MLQPPEAVQDFFCDKASNSVVGIVNYEKNLCRLKTTSTVAVSSNLLNINI